MHKVLTGVFLAAAVACSATFSPAMADDDDRPRRPGLPFVIKNLSDRVDRNSADIRTNAGHIADNFSAINSNAADIANLDARISDLEAGAGAGGERFRVEVDCIDDSDALLNPPIGGYFAENTTYEISGACNGPIVVNQDRVHFVGVDPAAAIVLPANTPDPGIGAVFGDGAHDLRLANLLIDASAWASPMGEAQQVGGIYARNAFVRVIDSDVVGGSYGINPYRNAIVRLQGEVNVSEFYNAGISAGDQSLITTRGQVNIGTSIAAGQYLVAVEAYRIGLVDLRGGLRVSLPPENEESDFEPIAIYANDNSTVRVRSGGVVDVSGYVFAENRSQVDLEEGSYNGEFGIEGGSLELVGTRLTGEIGLSRGGLLVADGALIQGDIEVGPGSVASMGEDVNQFGEIQVGSNGSLVSEDASMGRLVAWLGGSFDVQGGSFAGAEISLGSFLNVNDAVARGDIVLRDPLNILIYSYEESGSLNGNSVYLCGSTLSNVDPFYQSTGSVNPGCPFGP